MFNRYDRLPESEQPFDVFFARITPALAKELLSLTRIDNRRVSLERVGRYYDDMENGFWMPTHQGIAIDSNGYLMDGQHRLEAVVRSETTVIMLVAVGVDADTFWYLDSGFVRTAQSFLLGQYASARTALSRTLMQIEKWDGQASMRNVASGKFAPHRILTWLDNRPDVQAYGEGFSKASRIATQRGKFLGTSSAGLLVGGFVAGMKDPNRSTEWWEDINSLVEGDGLPVKNPLRALYQTSPVGGKVNNVNYMRALYTAVKYRDHEPLSQLRASNYAEVVCWEPEKFRTIDKNSGKPIVD